jgi:putative spermidine/putrescine transport system substrate-binding protein
MKLDWATIGGRDHYLPQGTSDCGVGAVAHNFALAWDRDKFQGAPTWADFWDVAKYPGKRGLQQGARMNLEIALMADGVAPGDVYRTLRTDDGVDRAFRKLDQIKPYLVWWKSPEEASKLLGSGNVLLTTAPSERVTAANQAGGRHFGMQLPGSLYEIESWGIVKGSPNVVDAQKLLALMGDPAREAKFASIASVGVLAKGATDALTPEQLAISPGNPANLSAALQIDDQFWNDNLEKLNRRFDAWVAH